MDQLIWREGVHRHTPASNGPNQHGYIFGWWTPTRVQAVLEWRVSLPHLPANGWQRHVVVYGGELAHGHLIRCRTAAVGVAKPEGSTVCPFDPKIKRVHHHSFAVIAFPDHVQSKL